MSKEDDLKSPYYVRMMQGPVGRFGAYMMKRSFDVGMDHAIRTLDGKWRTEETQAVTRRLRGLSPEQRAAVVDLVHHALIAALHGFLHGLSHNEKTIRLLFEEHDVARESDGLHGDMFWWLRDLSTYPYELPEPTAGETDSDDDD
jgi:hypothetical protein